jgi:hypothetical protein
VSPKMTCSTFLYNLSRRFQSRHYPHHRLCLDCGVLEGYHQLGQIVLANRHSHLLCGLCWRLCRIGLYCTVCYTCGDCLEHKVVETSLGPTKKQQLRDNGCPRCLNRALVDLGKLHPTAESIFDLLTLSKMLVLWDIPHYLDQ